MEIVQEQNHLLHKDFDMGLVVTIDGPAASGKTSVSRELARRMGWSWVSTGAFYRALAYLADHLKLNLEDENKLAELASGKNWRIEMTDAQTKVFFEDKDISDAINAEHVGSIASKISHFPLVRKSLLAAQRRCADITDGLVAEGRDCGTVVFPKAEIKFYLTASQENRAERRAKEQGLATEDLIKEQAVRDLQDSTRKVAPLQAAAGAIIVDTTNLNFNQVVEFIEKEIRKIIQ